jgi:hypothetical protein
MAAGTGAALVAGVDALIDAFQAAEIQAAMEISQLNPPGVLIPVPVPIFKLGGCSRITYTVIVVAPAVGRRNALGILGDLLDRTLAVLGGVVSDLRAVDVVPSNGEPLPGFQLTTTR